MHGIGGPHQCPTKKSRFGDVFAVTDTTIAWLMSCVRMDENYMYGS